MKDYIAKAKIMDKWSASSIYEGIVKRRKDPSILTKESDTQYQLKVFPMVGNETRKVKISYLLPVDWKSKSVYGPLPLGIITSSRYNDTKLNVITWPNADFTNPTCTDKNITFQEENDSIFGDYKKAVIPYSTLKTNPKIKFETAIENGLFFSKYQNNDEGIYQLALFPEALLDSSNSKNILVLIDYDASNSNMSTTKVLTTIESELISNLNETDSFNIMCSNLSIKEYSENWEIASQANIKSAFNTIKIIFKHLQ